ncbi:hypothetical protein GQ457_04G021860 [Hibiscus cannabinus]
MAEVVVSALVNTILDNLNSLPLEEMGLAGSLKTEVENLESSLTTIRAVLHDAEMKQWKSEAIKNWLAKLKQAAYHLEDVLDDFNTDALPCRSKVTTFFSVRNPLLFHLNMARKLKNARQKLDAISGEKSKFHLREAAEEAEIEPMEDRQTSSLVEESEVIGRADEKEKIISMLLTNASHHQDLSVYAICGMGGLGKTTMAQLVYNNENVAKAFDLRAWVCVSDDFDIKRLTKAIVESIEGNSCDMQELDPLQRRLMEKFAGKRFLLVLDDVWNEYHEKWDGLKRALRCGGRGSAVIVTTRLQKVAHMMATFPFHRLGCLSDEDSWSLFKQRAFGMGVNEGYVNLETIGRQIAQRCGGVPLAIKAIASILRFKSREIEWLRVKDSEIWDLEDEGSRILAVLRLSYQHLPPYMRQCFSFCSIFPKDFVMKKDELIALWMANGFIPSREPLDLHDTGCEIFSELTWRSFFQEIKEDLDGTVTCKMHDLIHDVAASIMRQESFAIELKERLKIPKTARHLFVHDNRSSTNIMDLTKLPSLQSLILENSGVKLSNPSRFISKQKYVKVLDFGYNFSIIAFGSLKHLRYLRLCQYNLKTLAESTSSLHNLQTLNLKSCHSLQMLPKGMKHLKNLRYLDIKGCYELTFMPAGLGQLSCLRKLSRFIVGKDNGCGIDELKDLALEGELSIIGLCNVKSSTEAKNANLIKKQNLRSLSLCWRVNDMEKSQHRHGNDEDILSGLQPHSSLKKLCIMEYQGVSFPNWMMDPLVPNLVEISLQKCERCYQLPPLGKLQFLKALTIVRMDALKYIDSNLYGETESSFPSLEVLKIVIAPCLEEWTTANGGQHFPLLSSLTIRYCPKLVKLPMLQSLKELQIEGTNVGLLQSLMMSATLLTSLQLGNAHESTDLPDGLLQHQTQLDKLSIVSSSLKSAPDLLDNLNTLKHLDFQCCEQLESLPQGLQNLSSLETLGLSQCDSFVSLPVPAYGFQGLSSLSSLKIGNCMKLASLSEGMRYLTSLRDLNISNCPELTSLPQSIQCLSSLRFLSICLCQRLASLPNEIQHLASLSELEIYGCSNLTSLPRGMRNLSALQTLRIKGCPHLEKRCKKERGEDWPNIAHIPSIQILRKACRGSILLFEINFREQSKLILILRQPIATTGNKTER